MEGAGVMAGSYSHITDDDGTFRMDMLDNMGAAVGGLPDASMQRRMIELIESLPSA